MTAIIPEMNFTKPGSVDPKKIFGPIEKFNVTNLFGSPALIKKLADSDAQVVSQMNSLNRVISAGAPVPAQTLSNLRNRLSDHTLIHTPYGATECLPIASISCSTILGETMEATKNGKGVCVGKPVSSADVSIIKIDDAPISNWSDELSLPQGEIGEIVVKAKQVTEGYYNRPKSTLLAKISDRDSGDLIHRMGDLGYLDSKGRLWFCGRKTHRVPTNKETLYTIPFEARFNDHAKVYRTALIGIGSGIKKPVLCVETKETLSKNQKNKLHSELLSIAKSNKVTQGLDHILFHPKFPVDIRHNSKIFREKLAVWAEGKIT